MVKYFGTDATPGSLQVAVCRNITPLVKKVKDHADSGGDCKDLNLIGDAKTGKGQNRHLHFTHLHYFLLPNHPRAHPLTEAVLAKYFGSDVTPNAIQLQINRNVQPTAKKVRDYADGGGDPKDLNIGSDGKTDEGKGGKRAKGQTSTCIAHYTLHDFIPFIPPPDHPIDRSRDCKAL